MFVDDVKYRGAWLPWSDSTTDEEDLPYWRAIVEWTVQNCPDYPKRLALMPTANAPDGYSDEYLWLTRNYASYRTHRGPIAGPVVAAWPGDAHLGDAVDATRADQAMIALQWGTSPDLTGWATAVGAFNARTGVNVAPLDPELDAAFKSMLIWTNELGGGALRGAGREKPQRYLRKLKAAGLDEDFVVTYSLALGAGGWRAKRLREHYRAA